MPTTSVVEIMTPITPTRLYIKQHSVTGLKYFGKTISNNIEKYHGSGKRWLNHIRKHGKNSIKTLWISEWFFTKESIIEDAIRLSKEYNIVESKEWANLKIETGIDGGLLPEYALKSISNKLSGRTKETHDYIKRSAEKKSLYTAENAEWLRESRKKWAETISNLTDEERKAKFGRAMTETQKLKLSRDRMGKTKENCERVRKMSDRKKEEASLLSAEERKLKYGTTKGMKWFHSDVDKKSIVCDPFDVPLGYSIGRKHYES